jgi:hypothetical protein
VLEVVATILAIVALFIPGVNIVAALLWIGFGLTAAALVGRVMLAMTGNGSWFDVAMDAFALLTFGVGKFASGLLEGFSEAAEKIAQTSLDGERAAMTEKTLAFMKQADGIFDDDEIASITKAAKVMAKDAIPDIGKFSGKFSLLTSAFLKIGGDADDVENLGKVAASLGRFSDDTQLADKMSGAINAVRVMGVNAGVSLVAGVGVPAIGGVGIDNSQGNPVTVGGVPINVQIPDNITTHIYNDIEHRTTAGIPDSVGTEAFNIAFYAGL